MRVLFITTPGLGHFHPLASLAQSLEARGHLVAFAALPSFASSIEASGFRFFPIGPTVREIHATADMKEYAELTDPIARRELVRQRVAPVVVPRVTLPDLLSWCESWTPDLIVDDNYEFAGRIAGDRLDIPYATLRVADIYRYADRHALVPALDAHRKSLGLPLDPDGAMLFRYLYLVNQPESFQMERESLPPTTFRYRRVVFDRSGAEQLPAWVHDLASRPTVYATAGTSVNRTPGLLETFAAALADEPINAILTIGRDRDPAEFGALPHNVHVERYIPQSLALPVCDLVLSHCGSGTLYAALDHGLPMVNIPIGMDQLENAARCAELRLGVTVASSAVSVDAIRAAVREVLTDPSYRERAQRIQRDLHALPGPDAAVELLERLAVEKRPYADFGATQGVSRWEEPHLVRSYAPHDSLTRCCR
jgi:UDP:flavonoid glycosyltransferase YjiC (YdhE family)